MAEYFPRHTLTWKVEEPPAFRRLTLSLVEMAILTGVALRLYRSIVLSHGASSSWLYLGGTFAIGAIILFAMCTMHLSNYPVRHWLWRAPAFALLETAAGMATSLILIWFGREPYGTVRAEFQHWPAMAANTLLVHLIAVVVFALILAGVVQAVRIMLLRRQHREHTAEAIHRAGAGMPLPPD